jgi:hypothetical protein
MTLTDAYDAIRTEIQRIRPGCRLIAVSKGQSPEKIRDLYQRGQREFGENYLQELEVKAAGLADLPDLRWIFIGQLQSNKIQRIVAVASEIQTATSEKHLRYIDRYARDSGKHGFPVFIEVNAGGEASKAGVTADGVPELVAKVAVGDGMTGIRLQGIMAIPPVEITDEDFSLVQKEPPELFRSMRRLADTVGMGKLSLGMSSDYRTAIAAGSDCVRIGRSLFGERQK